jgi:hypothetical protein
VRAETRAEVRELRKEMAGLRGDMAGLRTELRGEMAELRTELRGEIAELRSEMVQFRGETATGFTSLHAERRVLWPAIIGAYAAIAAAAVVDKL